jgi:hypothetical protein
VFGSSGQVPQSSPQYDADAGAERPGPYGGAFGQPPGGFGAAGGFNAPGGVNAGGVNQGPAGGPNQPGWAPYGYQPAPMAPPKQVIIASVIAFGIAGLSILLALFAFTSAGASMAELMTGDPGNQGVVAAAAVLSAALYVLPAIYVRKRRRWARTMLIVLAAIGIAGGLGALPGSLLGMAIHGALLAMLVQQPTKLWFTHR